MNNNPFQKATKEQIKLRLAISGVSGSGKTTWALKIAEHIAAQEGGRVAVLDTEGQSASLYSNLFDFDVLNVGDNFSPQTFMSAIHAAESHGYSVLVIDSFSHAWNGAGGILEIVDKAAGSGKGNFTGWKKGRPAQDQLVRAIINSSIHVILTLRAKTEWVMEANANGKMSPKKAGVGVIQSNDLEYEMVVALLIHRNHSATVTKSRCYELDEIGEDFASNQIELVASTIYGSAMEGNPAPTRSPAPHSGDEPQHTGGADNGGKPLATTLFDVAKAKWVLDGNTEYVMLLTYGTDYHGEMKIRLYDGRQQLFDAGWTTSKEDLSKDGEPISWVDTDCPTIEAAWVVKPEYKAGGYWDVVRICSANELDAHFGERETAPMPGMPLPEDDVDFYRESE